MHRVGVVGAGIAGLSAAYRLVKLGVDVVVFEAAGRPGGVIRSERSDGYLVEHGPNSIQTSNGELETLISELGLQGRRIDPSEHARIRFIVRQGKPVAAPASPLELITTPLFGSAAKLRLLREPFIARRPDASGESVADFTRRRLGREALDYAMNPFVAGVFAGDPEKLSMRHAFPRIANLEQRYGSIIRGQLAMRHEQPETRYMFSFDEGLEVVVRALMRELGERVRTVARATGAGRKNRRWEIAYAGGVEAFDAVICCAPLHRLKEMSLPIETDRLAAVTYAPLSVVALGYGRDDVGHPLDGFGMLVPEVEGDVRILGTLFTSSVFRDRAPEGHVLLTTFAGGARDPSAAGLPDDDMVELVHGDLRRLLDVKSRPVFRRRILWKHAIPQYELGYDEVLETIDRFETELPGWFMAGSYRSGISVADTVASGAAAGRRCAASLVR